MNFLSIGLYFKVEDIYYFIKVSMVKFEILFSAILIALPGSKNLFWRKCIIICYIATEYWSYSDCSEGYLDYYKSQNILSFLLS